ncbi:hypothetical protein FQZ97_756660 [compost metagenome]
MKTTIVLSAAASLVVIATFLGAAWIPSRQIAANECQANRIACFPPAVSFASLH